MPSTESAHSYKTEPDTDDMLTCPATIVTLTTMCCGELVTEFAVELTITLAMYVPSGKLAVVGVIVSKAGAVNEFKDVVIQPVGCPEV